MKLQHLAAMGVAVALTRLPIQAQAPSTAGNSVEFAAHTIGTELRGGYQVVVADLNKDGKPDVIGLASGIPELVWYENPGPALAASPGSPWPRHVIASGMSQMINAAANDLDGDGIPELALAQGFTTSPKTSTGIVSIVTHGPDVTAPWTVKEIDRVPTAHRLRWVNADDSGKQVLVMAPLIGADATPPDYKAPVSIYFYRGPDWKREVVTDAFTGLIHGIEPVAWEGVKGQAMLSAGFMGMYLHRFANGKWSPTELTKGDPDPWPKSGTSDVAQGKLGAQKFVAAIEPWHGNQAVIYQPSKDGWSRQMIDDTITDGHAIVTLDIDNDGRDEVVVGQRGGERSLVMYVPSANGETWTRRVLGEKGGMAGAGCAAADLNDDKRADVVCIGTATANLVWYENLGKR